MKNLRNMTVNEIYRDIVNNHSAESGYTYIILGKNGPTGKTYLCDALNRSGYKAFEIAETLTLCCRIQYNDDENHYIVDRLRKQVVIVLNQPLDYRGGRK